MCLRLAAVLSCCVLTLLSFCVPAAGAQPATGAPRTPMPRQGTPMPPRDTSARPTRPTPPVGTATITGRVVAAETGQPLARATVTASPSASTAQRGSEPGGLRGPGMSRNQRLAARTDDQGRYTIANVPAGEYTLTARRAGFVDTGFGQLTSRTPPRAVLVGENGTVRAIDFQLLRGGVIIGRVTTETGEPAERVSVRALRLIRQGGEVRPAGASSSDQTDDLGQFRLFGLAPGEYIVMADPRGPEIRFRDGSMTGGFDNSVQGVTQDDIPTFGPGTLNAAAAQRVRVDAGQEASVDVQLIAARMVAIRGRVTASSGEPLEGGNVSVRSADGFSILPSRFGGIASDGQFELTDVAPGTYTIMAQSTTRGRSQTGHVEELAMQTIAVDGDDMVVSLTTVPGSTARGRLTLEGDPSALAGRTLSVGSVPARPFTFTVPGRGRVQPDLTFEISGLRGEQTIGVGNLPDGWWVRDVRVGGQSALEGYDFGHGRAFTGLEIVVSTQPTGIAGTVTLPTGATAADYAVIVFPEDEALWEWSIGRQPRSRVVRPALGGTFRITGLRPGSYYAMAVSAAQADSEVILDPDQLRELTGRARTIDVPDGGLASLTLPLVTR